MSTSVKGKNAVLNMTEGKPMGLLLRFAIPMLIGNVFQQLYNLADSVIVGRLVNADALAAIGASSSVTFLFFALCNGIGSGGGIITSQFFGNSNSKAVKKCITNTGYIMLIFPTLVGVAAYFLSGSILELLETPEEIMPDALAYIRIMCIGIIFVSLYNYIASMLRALGDSKTPLYFLIISCIINIVLDLYFVYKLGMGVTGAGIATAVSQLLSGAACMLYAVKTNPYFKFSKEDFVFDKRITWQVIKLGVPLSLQFSLIAISCMALQRVVNSFGPVAVAAFTATSRIEQLIHQPYQTLGTSLSTYTGQNYGAGKNQRIVQGYRKALVFMAFFSLAMLPVMQIFGRDIVSIFVKEEEAEVITMGAKALRITSLFYVFLGIIYVIRGVLNGLGDALFALINGIVEVIGRFSVPVFMTGIAAIGVWGIWWATGIVWFISGAAAWLRYVFYKRKAFDRGPGVIV